MLPPPGEPRSAPGPSPAPQHLPPPAAPHPAPGRALLLPMRQDLTEYSAMWSSCRGTSQNLNLTSCIPSLAFVHVRSAMSQQICCHAGVLQSMPPPANGSYEPIKQMPAELGKLITALPPIHVSCSTPCVRCYGMLWSCLEHASRKAAEPAEERCSRGRAGCLDSSRGLSARESFADHEMGLLKLQIACL